MSGSTLFDKIWNQHIVADLGNGLALLHVDRHLLHDLNAGNTLKVLHRRGLRMRNPELAIATPDHGVSTQPGRVDDTNPPALALLTPMREETKKAGVRFYDINEDGQGIVHVVGPELGFTQPGCLLVCGDSHTCTHGGLGALAWGIGRSEIVHVLATQCIYQSRPKRMRVRFDGALAPGVFAKDLILHLIGTIGAAAGTGFAVEYAGSAVRAMPVEGRLTICNLSIELGAKFGMVAPDDVTYEYLAGRPFAPKGSDWDRALDYWRSLPTDDDAVFDTDIAIDTRAIAPQVTWGTSPQDVVGIDSHVPDPTVADSDERRKAMTGALAYMGLSPRQPIAGLPVDWVFIGSC